MIGTIEVRRPLETGTVEVKRPQGLGTVEVQKVTRAGYYRSTKGI